MDVKNSWRLMGNGLHPTISRGRSAPYRWSNSVPARRMSPRRSRSLKRRAGSNARECKTGNCSASYWSV